MLRHWYISLALLTFAALSLRLGYQLGNRSGEAVVRRTANGRSHVPATAVVPPPPGAAAARESQGSKRLTPRSRDEIAKFLADLKKRLFESGTSASGSLRIGLNDPAAAKELEGLSLEEVRLAMDVVNEMPPGLDRTGFSMALMQRWAREDAPAALDYFRSHRDDAGPFGTLWLTAIVTPWMEKDPAAAARGLAATLQSEDDDILQGSISNTVWMVAEKLMRADPDEAMRYVGELPEWARESARSAVAKQVHGPERTEFLNDLRALPEGPQKSAWMMAAATALAPVDPAAASQWIDSLGLSDAARAESTRAVFEKWMTHEPRQATEWAAARLPESAHGELVARSVESWAPREPNECGRWLSELQFGPHLDAAFATFARSVAAKDVESARAWAERISDPVAKSACLDALNRAK